MQECISIKFFSLVKKTVLVVPEELLSLWGKGEIAVIYSRLLPQPIFIKHWFCNTMTIPPAAELRKSAIKRKERV